MHFSTIYPHRIRDLKRKIKQGDGRMIDLSVTVRNGCIQFYRISFLSSPPIENYWMCQSRRDNGPLFLADTWPDLNHEVANVNWDSSVARLITCCQTGHRSPSDWCNSSPCCFIMIETCIDCETNKKHLDSISFNKETIHVGIFNQPDRSNHWDTSRYSLHFRLQISWYLYLVIEVFF